MYCMNQQHQHRVNAGDRFVGQALNTMIDKCKNYCENLTIIMLAYLA